MRRPVVDDPEHPLRRGVGLARHHLLDEPAERDDAGGVLAAAEHLGPVHVVGGQVRQRPAPFILVLDTHQPCSPRRQGGVAAAACLDGGLLIGADHELALGQRPVLKDAGIQVQHHGRLGGEVGVTGEDPRPVEPGADGVSVQDPPHRRRRYRRHDRPGHKLTGKLSAAPTSQRHTGRCRQLTGEGFDLDVDQRGERIGVGPSASDRRGRPCLPRRNACAT